MLKKSPMDSEIDKIILEMEEYPVTSETYQVYLERLTALCQARSLRSGQKISPDTVANIIGNIIGILIILNFEKSNVITTKAMSFLKR